MIVGFIPENQHQELSWTHSVAISTWLRCSAFAIFKSVKRRGIAAELKNRDKEGWGIPDLSAKA